MKGKRKKRWLLRYIAKRMAATIPLLLVVTAVVFVLVDFAPGDPAVRILGPDATPERVEQVRVSFGLDKPLYIQYLNFIRDVVLRGDLGRSYQSGRPVAEELARTLPVSLKLTFVAVALSSIVGILVGVLSAVRQYSWIDSLTRIIVLGGVSIPVFWLGLMLIVLFSVKLRLVPSAGWGTMKHMILPAVTLATFPLAMITRLTRSSMLEVIRQDYVRTARAKGLSQRAVIYRHCLRNAFIPVVTVIGLQFGVLLAGSVLTETIFAIPGMGRMLINAVFALDYPIIRACVLVIAALFMGINLLVDISYTYLDPRIRFE